MYKCQSKIEITTTLICLAICAYLGYALSQDANQTKYDDWVYTKPIALLEQTGYVSSSEASTLKIKDVFYVRDIALLHPDVLDNIPAWLASPDMQERNKLNKNAEEVREELIARHSSYYIARVSKDIKDCVYTLFYTEDSATILPYCMPFISEEEAKKIIGVDTIPILVQGSNGLSMFGTTRFEEIYLFGEQAVDAKNGSIYEITDPDGNSINPLSTSLRPTLATGWSRYGNPPFYLDLPYRVRLIKVTDTN